MSHVNPGYSDYGITRGVTQDKKQGTESAVDYYKTFLSDTLIAIRTNYKAYLEEIKDSPDCKKCGQAEWQDGEIIRCNDHLLPNEVMEEVFKENGFLCRHFQRDRI